MSLAECVDTLTLLVLGHVPVGLEHGHKRDVGAWTCDRTENLEISEEDEHRGLSACGGMFSHLDS